MRGSSRAAAAADADVLVLALPFRPPLDAAHLLGFLGAHAVAGVEDFDGHTYSRTLDLPHGPALVSVSTPAVSEVLEVRLRLTHRRDRAVAVTQIRHLLDLDADPLVIDEVLGAVAGLGDLVARRPGLRCPGASNGFELAARTVVGQQVSLAGARTVLGRIVADHGRAVFDGRRMFPTPVTVAALDPTVLPLPRARGRALVALATAVADGTLVLDSGADRAAAHTRLLGLPGVGPWTADYVRMRALGDPDILLDTDLVIRRLLSERALWPAAAAPWRSYLTHHLWADFLARRAALPTAHA